jgi:hypothetical protein
MKKTTLTAAALAAMMAAGAANAADIGAAVSNTATAVGEKAGQAVDSIKGSYHQTMANEKAEDAKEDLTKGNLGDAAADAKAAVEHQVSATQAKSSAADKKAKASKHWNKAKAAATTSATTTK